MTVEELYKITKGVTSQYIFPKGEEDIAEFKQLAKDGYVKFVNNSAKTPMYVITLKTVVAVEGELDVKDLRAKQLENLEKDMVEDEPKELTNKLEI
jgi:hypothetical protein